MDQGLMKKEDKIETLFTQVDGLIKTKQIKDVPDVYHFKAQQCLHKIIHEVQSKQHLDQQQKFRYDQCQATINELDGRYFLAATEYYNLSLVVNQNQNLQFLNSAIICGILDKAGPKRSALLANINKDPRVQTISISILLNKMVKQLLITPADQDQLIRHGHQATTAIIEHNILAISNIYDNIKIQTLAKHINLDYFQTTQALEVMVGEERLKAKIDQVTDVVYFENDNQEEFSQSIEKFCNLLNQTSERVKERIQ